MTNQEIFDIVVTHARKQNKRAVHLGRCQYRAPEGLKCFAGALIKDEFYDRHLEGLGCHFSSVQHALIQSGVGRNQMELVFTLQRVHDRHLVSEWPTQFIELAAKEGLVYVEDNPT